MLLRIIVEGRVGELVEQAQRFALVVPVLAVLERQIGELAPLVGPVPVPALFDDGARDRAGEAVGREGLGAAAIYVARPLVEQDRRGERGVAICHDGLGRQPGTLTAPIGRAVPPRSTA